jgi:hypothetical protein
VGDVVVEGLAVCVVDEDCRFRGEGAVLEEVLLEPADVVAKFCVLALGVVVCEGEVDVVFEVGSGSMVTGLVEYDTDGVRE